MPAIRPAKPKWQNSPDGLLASTALGEFKVLVEDDGLWRAHLNEGPFPVLYETLDAAQLAAKISALSKGHPGTISLDWVENDLKGTSCVSTVGVFHVLPSQDIAGYFVMHENDSADILFSSQEEACDACAQYIMFVWYSLSEIT